MKNKILFITTSAKLGGAENLLIRLIRSLKKKHTIQVCIIGTEGPITEELKAINIKTNHLNITRKYQFWRTKELHKIIKDFRPDIIQSMLYHPNILTCRLKKRYPEIKCFIAEHSGGLIKNPLRKYIMKKLYPAADKIIVVSGIAKEKLEDINIPEEKIIYIPNGIDLKNYTRSKLRKKIIITSAGRLEKIKGHKYLIDAVEPLRDHNFQLRILGDGSLRQELEEQILENQLDKKVIIEGYRKDIPRRLQGSNIFILPSLYEDQPLALIEAMASGNAIIASRTGGIPEMISDKEGLLVEPENIQKLTEAIGKLLENRKLIRKYCDLAFRRSKAFSIEKTIKRYEEIYR